jgi:ATP-dependent DNA ligase
LLVAQRLRGRSPRTHNKQTACGRSTCYQARTRRAIGCGARNEGIVCKRIDLPYRHGPSKSWIKVKNKKHPAMLRVKEAFELERRGRGHG